MLIWRSPYLVWLCAPLLLAARHVEQCLAGSEEVRSCESWMQLKIHLAANGKFTTEGQTYITYQTVIDMLLGKKEIEREMEIFHLSLCEQDIASSNI